MLGAEQIDMLGVSRAVERVRIKSTIAIIGSSVKVRELCAATTVVEQLCAELYAYEISLTLVHGDLYFGNNDCRTGSVACCFYDWGSSFIGIPFFAYRYSARVSSSFAHKGK